MTMRRATLLTLLLLLAALIIPAGTALAQPGGSASTAAAASAASDFDNDGFADLAVGVPGENDFAGAVNVLYGSGGGLTGNRGLVFTGVGGSAIVGEFGAALAAGDFDNDGFADLAAGARFRTVGGEQAAGSVGVLYGSGAGLTTAGGQLFTQVGGAVEGGDVFGSALATGDFNQNGFADLAVGAPFEDVGGAELAGAVSVLYGSGGGLSTAGGRLFTQVAGAVEDFDLFGSAVAGGDLNDDGFDDLIAGAPWERVGSVALAGTVSVIRGSASGLTTAGGQRINQVGGTVEVDDQFGAEVGTGDFDNDGITDLAVGAPAEDIGNSTFNAGAMSAGGQLFTQNSPGVPGTAEDFDSFGGNAFNAG
jgi:hypothetical protein